MNWLQGLKSMAWLMMFLTTSIGCIDGSSQFFVTRETGGGSESEGGDGEVIGGEEPVGEPAGPISPFITVNTSTMLGNQVFWGSESFKGSSNIGSSSSMEGTLYRDIGTEIVLGRQRLEGR